MIGRHTYPEGNTPLKDMNQLFSQYLVEQTLKERRREAVNRSPAYSATVSRPRRSRVFSVVRLLRAVRMRWDPDDITTVDGNESRQVAS